MTAGGPELLKDPLAQELLASRIPARLAYVWPDGTPRVVSIRFHWDGTGIVMAPLPGAPELKALQTSNRVALTIDTDATAASRAVDPGSGRGDPIRRVVDEYAKAAVRYLGKAQGEAYTACCRRTSAWAASPCVPTG